MTMTQTPHSRWSSYASALLVSSSLMLGGCLEDDEVLVDGPSEAWLDEIPGQGPEDAPGQQGEGSAEHEQARSVARLSADQLYRALEVATGQRWAQFDKYAATLGKPDFAEVTEEGSAFSVTFDKFAHDAARNTCRAALDADLGAAADATILSEPVLLRFAGPEDRLPTRYAANLRYLLLRFLAIEVEADDERLEPWMHLLMAPPPEGEELSDELMAERWWAVCVGLATHPDFLSY